MPSKLAKIRVDYTILVYILIGVMTITACYTIMMMIIIVDLEFINYNYNFLVRNDNDIMLRIAYNAKAQWSEAKNRAVVYM